MELKEEFVTIQPKSDLLKKYISYFYFHKSGSDNRDKSYIYYPNHKVALTIYKNSISDFQNLTCTTKPSKIGFYQHLYIGITPHSILVEIIPPFDKIGIVFQPLGINYFLNISLQSAIKNQLKAQFNYFKNDMESVCDEIYNTKVAEKKADLLEEFFLQHFCSLKEPRIVHAVECIINAQENYTVTDLALELGINRKTLLRLFQEHLNCTVKEYLDIVRFRKALNMYQTNEKKPLLTQVALENGYYDQSEFIKHFKKVTGYNPKRLFKDIQHLGNEDTFWTLMDKK